MILESLPFHIGAQSIPFNPNGLPGTLPYELVFDPMRCSLGQSVTVELSRNLNDAYRHGTLNGTPLDDNDFGRPYADDFLSFIIDYSPKKGRTLEVGAGRGYLTHRLCMAGYEAIGIEPGPAHHETRSKVEIVRDFFPSPRVQGQFDLICSYAVLEHVLNPVEFLQSIKRQLALGGRAIFSVPDCTAEIVAGDPGMLLHEHISYFDAGQLTRLFQSVGLNSLVVESGYGRCLYAVASSGQLPDGESAAPLADGVVANYQDACTVFIAQSSASITQLLAQGSVGIYCPGRGLALLSQEWPLRFFDDDPSLHGKFLPPFRHQIESRAALMSDPVQNLVILSRTFGQKIRDSLLQDGYQGQVVTVDELVQTVDR